jgi:hypothetical protein
VSESKKEVLRREAAARERLREAEAEANETLEEAEELEKGAPDPPEHEEADG